MSEQKPTPKLIEIWGDVVEVGSMVKAAGLAIVLTMGLYFLAPADNRPLQLAMGLGGAVLGFIINVKLYKPKRVITVQEDEHDTDA